MESSRFAQLVMRILQCLGAATAPPGAVSSADAAHAGALCAWAFRRAFTARAGEAQQLSFLTLALALLDPRRQKQSPSAADGGA